MLDLLYSIFRDLLSLATMFAIVYGVAWIGGAFEKHDGAATSQKDETKIGLDQDGC